MIQYRSWVGIIIIIPICDRNKMPKMFDQQLLIYGFSLNHELKKSVNKRKCILIVIYNQLVVSFIAFNMIRFAVYKIYCDNHDDFQRILVGDVYSLALNDKGNLVNLASVLICVNSIFNRFLLNLIRKDHLEWLRIFHFSASKICAKDIAWE